MGAFLERLAALAPELDWSGRDSEAEARLERFAAASPLYAQTLERHPDWVGWLEAPASRKPKVPFPVLLDDWRTFRAARGDPGRDSSAYPGLLRAFRRKMSLRIAYRDVGEFAPASRIVEELTQLAEFCLREVYLVAQAQWQRRLGEPWDTVLDRPARFCILGLGKLGGRELNFSSDIDLIYLYEGEGHTRRDGKPTGTSNGEFFHRLGETITQLLNQRDADGFLFRADLRLRPGGAMAPLVPSIEAVENYYAATGQTWERMALLKARPVAGDVALGAELLENLHSFRYPRHPPPSLLAEVAAMKVRTEREIVGQEALERNVKSGYGGIREIEFIVQAMQLLHAGRFPFLQTHSTIEALRQLVRYDLIEGSDATFLEQAYWFLRRVEHRVQMSEERQTHELPVDPEARSRLAASLGFSSREEFEARLTSCRERVREHYRRMFREAPSDAVEAANPWWDFFADAKTAPAIRQRLETWFGQDGEGESERDLRLFVRGTDTQPLMRDQVQRFASLVPTLDRVLPGLARPSETLRRISAFGDRYASRNQFLAACTLNPQFFEVLALLFDRSRFIFELLSRHPEIFDEVLRPEILRKRKDRAARERELGEHPGGEEDDLVGWLWLYVRAEQVRTAIGQLLAFVDDEQVQQELSCLADAVLADALRRSPGGERLLVVALGRYAGSELTFGSDLDLVFITGDDDAPALAAANEKLVRTIRQRLSGGPGRDATFALDLRLRPHGDSGPLVPSLKAFQDYFRNSAQTWERQVLTRARVVLGPPKLAAAWDRFVAGTAYGEPLTPAEADALWQMRLRVERERDVVEPRERAFKTGAGGLVEIQFGLQILQLRHGAAHPEIRTPNTARGWRALAAAGLVPAATADRILENLRQLERLECVLRRDQNRALSVIPAAPEEQRALARWLGERNWDAFWAAHVARLQETRTLVRGLLDGLVSSTTLETHR